MTLTVPAVAGAWSDALGHVTPRLSGRVSSVNGIGFEVTGLKAGIGEYLVVETDQGDLSGKVTALREETLVAIGYSDLKGLRVGQPVYTPGGPPQIPTGDELLGRVLDGLGRPIDSFGSLAHLKHVSALNASPSPLDREMVTEPFHTGIRAIDSAIPAARGQRIGIFSGSGVGKSTLLSMVVAFTDAEVIVVGMVGERGREVRDFIEGQLGAEGMARSVVVVATGDEPALMRISAANTATRIAEDFRDQGRNVLLVIDSVTRFAMAQREIGLAAGEVPASRGYPASVLTVLPRLLERSGNSAVGSITAIYTVLVEGDDINDPISDAVRGILDGHIVLSRDLANAGHFPAIDVLASVSRLNSVLYTSEQAQIAARMRMLLGAYEASRDLIEIGAYVDGSSAVTDAAIAVRPDLEAFLRQSVVESSSSEQTWSALRKVLEVTDVEAN